MTTLSSAKREKYFVFKKNNSFEEFYSREDALKCGDKHFLIIDNFKEFFAPTGGYDWRISKFSFIDSNNQPFNFSINSWTIHEIDTTYKSSNRIAFNIIMSDPSRKIRHISRECGDPRKYEDPNTNDMKLIQIAFDQLAEYSKFQSWEQLDLQAENKKLKEVIQSLNKQISDLQNTD